MFEPKVGGFVLLLRRFVPWYVLTVDGRLPPRSSTYLIRSAIPNVFGEIPGEPRSHNSFGSFNCLAQSTSSAGFRLAPSSFELHQVLPSRPRGPPPVWSTAPPSLVGVVGVRPGEAGIAKGGEEPAGKVLDNLVFWHMCRCFNTSQSRLDYCGCACEKACYSSALSDLSLNSSQRQNFAPILMLDFFEGPTSCVRRPNHTNYLTGLPLGSSW